MAVHLKNIQDQVIVITGASSGIGRTTARRAAERGARVVLAARSEEELKRIADELNREHPCPMECPRAHAVAADVTSQQDVRKIAEEAKRVYGGFDTWVNNAGVSIYGKLEEVPFEDFRQLFETNFWGVVRGSILAAGELRKRFGDSNMNPMHGQEGSAGALINVGSTLSDRAIPLQGMYCASKFAVKGFTDSLRMELEHDDANISVTLIKPAAVDTPYQHHAKNYMAEEPRNPAPVYAPEVVADAILHAAEHPVRSLFAGGAGKGFSMMEKYAPWLTDKYMEHSLYSQQQSGQKVSGRRADALHRPSGGGDERSGYPYWTREHSFYTAAEKHPWVAAAAATGIGLLAVGAVAALTKGRDALDYVPYFGGDGSDDASHPAPREYHHSGDETLPVERSEIGRLVPAPTGYTGSTPATDRPASDPPVG